MSPWLALAAPPLAGLGRHAWLHVRAARARTAHARACPYEDDEPRRSVLHDAVDCARETIALVRLVLAATRPLPRAWRALATPAGDAPLVVLLPERGLSAASLRTLGRRLADDLGARPHVEPRRHPWVPLGERVERMRDRVGALRAAAPRRPLLLIGHGEGGRVACLVAGAVAAPVHAFALATAQRDAQAPPASVPRGVDATCLYATYDAVVAPPERAYLAGAFNVALADVGHFGIVLARRPYELLREAISDIPDAAVVGARA